MVTGPVAPGHAGLATRHCGDGRDRVHLMAVAAAGNGSRILPLVGDEAVGGPLFPARCYIIRSGSGQLLEGSMAFQASLLGSCTLRRGGCQWLRGSGRRRHHPFSRAAGGRGGSRNGKQAAQGEGEKEQPTPHPSRSPFHSGFLVAYIRFWSLPVTPSPLPAPHSGRRCDPARGSGPGRAD